MRVLLSTIGSRGDVQPMVALALQLRELGQEVRICAPPDFREWIGTLGIPFVPVGPEVRQTAAPNPSAAQAPPTPEQLRQLMEDTVADFSPDSPDFNLTLRGRLTLQGQLRISSAVFTFHAAKAAELRN
jgi:UDP:flavonoid glycosyltransferase YjiC (YdhE family)